MRKWLAIFFILIVLLFVLPYVLIPNKIYLKQEVSVPVSTKAFSRTILEDSTWVKWWPGKTTSNTDNRWPHRFLFGDNFYQLVGKHLPSQVVVIESDKGKIVSQLLYVPSNLDSVLVSWQGVVYPSALPWARVSHYYTAKNLESEWKDILNGLAKFYQQEENVYGLKVEKQLVKDSNLISTTIKTSSTPDTKEVYKLVEELNAFAKKQGAATTGPPMLNVTRMVDTNERVYYRTQVALPVNKKLSNEGKIAFKWMLPRGNILVAEVTGGPSSAQRAMERMENYVSDYNYVSPAIPFQSLITDRLNNPDTAKWVTKIYWPVM